MVMLAWVCVCVCVCVCNRTTFAVQRKEKELDGRTNGRTVEEREKKRIDHVNSWRRHRIRLVVVVVVGPIDRLDAAARGGE